MSPKSTNQVTIVDRSRRSPSLRPPLDSPQRHLRHHRCLVTCRRVCRNSKSLTEIAKVSKSGSIGQFSSVNDMEDYNCRRHRVRHSWRIGVVATGLTARITTHEDSASADLAIHGEMPGSLAFDVKTRHAAAEALSLALENHESDDAVTLTIVARVTRRFCLLQIPRTTRLKPQCELGRKILRALRMPHPGRKKKNIMLGARIQNYTRDGWCTNTLALNITGDAYRRYISENPVANTAVALRLDKRPVAYVYSPLCVHVPSTTRT